MSNPRPSSLLPLTPTLTALSVVLFVWLNGWLHHIWCAILLNDITNLHMPNLGTLVPQGPWCAFYVTRRQVYWGLKPVFFSGTLIWCHTHINTHKQTQRHTAHSGASRLTHPYKYIFTSPIMWSQQLSLLHWMNNSLILNIYFPRCLFFSKLFTCKSHNLLIRCYKTRSSCKTQILLIKMV